MKTGVKVKSLDLVVRCMARQEDGAWVAICIDYALAAQGASLAEARDRLHEQIGAYVREAVTVDRKHAYQLLNRKAPLRDRLIYKLAEWRSRFQSSSARDRAYSEALPLAPMAA